MAHNYQAPAGDPRSANTAQAAGTGRKAPDSPTGLGKQSWLATLRRAFKGYQSDQLSDRAATLTYFGVLAIFPGMLVLVSILGLLGHSQTQSLLHNIDQIAPGGVKSFLDKVIHQAQSRQTSAGIGAIVGVVLALWSSSGYVAGFMRASNAIYGVGEGRPIWKTAPVRLAITLVMVVLLVVAIVIVAVSGRIAAQVGSAIGVGHAAVLAWDIAKWPVLVIIVAMMFGILYWAAPNVKQPKFRWLSPGGLLAVIIWLVASGLFAVYLVTFASYNKTYGSLAGVIIFLVWLWISNLAILLGAEFNAELERTRAIAAGVPADLDPIVRVRDTRKLRGEELSQAETAARAREANGEDS